MDDKLVIEVPFKDGEKERFLQYVEDGAWDMGKIVRKLLMKSVETHDKHMKDFKEQKRAVQRKRRACRAELRKKASSADQEVNHLADK